MSELRRIGLFAAALLIGAAHPPASSQPPHNGISGTDRVHPAQRGAVAGTPPPAQSGTLNGTAARRRS